MSPTRPLSTLPQRKVAAFRRRARKLGLEDHVVERWVNAHGASYVMTVVSGNSWMAPWVVAICGDYHLTRDGGVYTGVEDLMRLFPAFKAALMRRYMGDV